MQTVPTNRRTPQSCSVLTTAVTVTQVYLEALTDCVLRSLHDAELSAPFWRVEMPLVALLVRRRHDATRACAQDCPLRFAKA
jgi:hypothetical protein